MANLKLAVVAASVVVAWTMLLAAEEPLAAQEPSATQEPQAAVTTENKVVTPRISELDPRIAADLLAGRPLVTEVVIPLCSNEQVNCGDKYAGQAGSLRANLYWNAAYGAKRFFDNPKYGWTLVHAEEGVAPVLATRVYRKMVLGEPWGVEHQVEQLVVLRAVHGAYINQALHDFYLKSVNGSSVSFKDGEQTRSERVHAVGYAGHNRMMDGVSLPVIENKERAQALPSFVLACLSQQYFEPSMRRDGVPEIVMTRTYMAPEAYVIDATLRGIAANLPRDELRAEVVRTYAKWQRISETVAGATFAEL